jgi:azurin
MKFNVTKIEVAAGEEITIVLQNVGTMPKQAMGHNLVLLKKDVNAQAFATAALRSAATEYIPAALADQVIGHTKLLGPKQKDSFTFKAPEVAGDYVYLCSFPAHFVAGMKGVMTVK